VLKAVDFFSFQRHAVSTVSIHNDLAGFSGTYGYSVHRIYDTDLMLMFLP